MRPFHEMNLFQPFERLRVWAEPDGDNDTLADVRQDVRHVLDSHKRLWDTGRDNQRHIWYQSGSEGNDNIDISWRERAEELERKLNAALSVMWMAKEHAEAGGSGGPEMRDYRAAEEILDS